VPVEVERITVPLLDVLIPRPVVLLVALTAGVDVLLLVKVPVAAEATAGAKRIATPRPHYLPKTKT
jgi:hypothetical protein